MEIIYEVIEQKIEQDVVAGGGCYTECNVNTDYGNDYYCCENFHA